jgi:hypothetical protein
METTKQPIDFTFTPDAKITLTAREFNILTKPLQMFEMALSIRNMKMDEALNNKILLPVYEEDVDEQGKLKDEKAFFEKHKPSVIIAP